MHLGKRVRLRRLLNASSGRLLTITVDHGIARGVLPGLIDVQRAIDEIVWGVPDAMTMHKGIAERCFEPHAGKVPLIIKCTSFSPYHKTLDVWVTDVEEAIRLGADAISMGVIVGGEHQPKMLENLGRLVKEAESLGLPVVTHIYPRGEYVEDQYHFENVRYAVRVGAELGVDVIKTHYTGSPDTFAKVVEAVPVPVVLAGGEGGKALEDYLRMTRDALDAGAAGVAYGRFVWQNEEPGAVVRALRAIIHENRTVEEALEVYREAMAERRHQRSH
ncbi:MAG: 2-amino-3,7-dideoxy-D-threo-hept-6-ulosonate synthase [Bacillota bacterium]